MEVGKCANLVVTRNNPLDDLRALRHINMAVAQGRKIDHPKVKVKPRVAEELDKFL